MKLVVLRITLTLVSFNVMAESKLATFREGEDELGANIEFPSVKNDLSVIIACQAIISQGGQIRWNACFPDDFSRDRKFIRAINNGAGKSKFNSAIYEDERIEVMVNFRVRFQKEGQTKNIEVFLNNGIDTKLYGDSYLSPQRVIGYPRRFQNQFQNCFTRFDKIYAIESRIGPDLAQPISINVFGADRCEERWKSFSAESVYIPGSNNGATIETVYKEVRYSSRVSGREIVRWPRRQNLPSAFQPSRYPVPIDY